MSETIGQRVKRLRKATDLNQRSLADKARMHFLDIAYLEDGKVKLPVVYLIRIAEALGCTIDDLLPNEPA